MNLMKTNRKGKSLLNSMDFQALVMIHKILVNKEYNHEQQIHSIQNVMVSWAKACQKKEEKS